MEALIRKNTGDLRGSCTLSSLLTRVIERLFGVVRRVGDVKLQLAGVGKLSGWVLELNFAGQIISFKFLF